MAAAYFEIFACVSGEVATVALRMRARSCLRSAVER